MKQIAFLAVVAILSWGTPALGGFDGCCQSCDDDLDGVCWEIDNCQVQTNPVQDDTDSDDCGNLCDADYDNDGIVGFSDFGAFTANFGSTDELYMHLEPIDGGSRQVGFGDFGFFSANFGTVPGPSGTTAGTSACP